MGAGRVDGVLVAHAWRVEAHACGVSVAYAWCTSGACHRLVNDGGVFIFD